VAAAPRGAMRKGGAGGGCKPDSVPPSGGGPHSSGPGVTAGLVRPTREPCPPRGRRGWASLGSPTWPCSAWGLPCPPRHRGGGALLPHPFTLAPGPTEGGLLSVALSLASPRPGFPRHAAHLESGLSSGRRDGRRGPASSGSVFKVRSPRPGCPPRPAWTLPGIRLSRSFRQGGPGDGSAHPGRRGTPTSGEGRSAMEAGSRAPASSQPHPPPEPDLRPLPRADTAGARGPGPGTRPARRPASASPAASPRSGPPGAPRLSPAPRPDHPGPVEPRATPGSVTAPHGWPRTPSGDGRRRAPAGAFPPRGLPPLLGMGPRPQPEDGLVASGGTRARATAA